MCMLVSARPIRYMCMHIHQVHTVCISTIHSAGHAFGIIHLTASAEVSYASFPSGMRSWLHSAHSSHLTIIGLGRLFVCTNLQNWPENLHRPQIALFSAVQKVSSTGVLILNLRNEGFPTFCQCLTTECHLGFMEENDVSYGLREAGGLLQQTFHYCCSLIMQLYVICFTVSSLAEQ